MLPHRPGNAASQFHERTDMQRLRRRAEFLKAATGAKASATPFVLQAVRRGEDGLPRIGFTVSKKVGTAVERNRVRRRLRAIVKQAATLMRPGYDYVLVGRRAALQEPFERMVATFDSAVRRVHAAPPGRMAKPAPRH
jgi:ribonuclease P protein component